MYREDIHIRLYRRITSFILEAKVNNKKLDETGNKSDFFWKKSLHKALSLQNDWYIHM